MTRSILFIRRTFFVLFFVWFFLYDFLMQFYFMVFLCEEFFSIFSPLNNSLQKDKKGNY